MYNNFILHYFTYDSLQAPWLKFKTDTGLDIGSTNNFLLKPAEGSCNHEGAIVGKCNQKDDRCNKKSGDIEKCSECKFGL